jgi:hypothetical protein
LCKVQGISLYRLMVTPKYAFVKVFNSFVKILYRCDYLHRTEVSGTLRDVYNTIIPTHKLFSTLYIYICVCVCVCSICIVISPTMSVISGSRNYEMNKTVRN